MTAPAPTAYSTGSLDAFQTSRPAPRWRYLHHINPLAKLAAPVVPALALLFVRDLDTPLAFLVLSYLVLLTGARMTRALALTLFVAFPLAILVTGAGLTLWMDATAVGGSTVFSLGSIVVTTGAIEQGFAAALRLAAIIAVSLIAGVTTAGPDLVRTAVQYLKLPYRIGYTALAAYRFVPRFKHELSIIRSAHRVRGRHGGRGPFVALARGWGYILPLMAGAIRHAERVALAMDSRAFGAHSMRTERHEVPLRARDFWFVGISLAVTVAIFALCYPWS